MTVHVKLLQICTLISSFCWKYIKFQLNKYRWAISHDTKEWCNIWRKTDLLLQKMTRISWILTQALQSLRNLHFDWFLLCKLYNVWPKKVHDILHELSYMTLKSDAHFEEKMPCDLENGMRNLAYFHQSTWKRQNWGFDRILLSKVENAWIKIYRGVICNDTEEWCKI